MLIKAPLLSKLKNIYNRNICAKDSCLDSLINDLSFLFTTLDIYSILQVNMLLH